MANGSDWTRGNFKKTSNDVSFGVRDTGSLFHCKPAIPGFTDGTPGGFSQDEFAGVDEAVARNKATYEDDVAPRSASAAEVIAAAKSDSDRKQTFNEAFKAAENGSTFEWNGKQYKKEYAKGAADKKAEAAESRSSGSTGKSFSEDVAERRSNRTVEKLMARNEDYGNESRRQVNAPSKPAGRGVIDTSNVDSKTLLPRR
jgi:hypothetical protein